MTENDLERDRAAERKSYDIRLVDLEIFHQLGDIISHGFGARRRIDIRSVPVTLQFNRDYLPVLGESV